LTFISRKDIIIDMDQVKSTNVIKAPEVVLNPVFFLPPDVVDVRVGSSTDSVDDDGVTYDDIVNADDVLTEEDLAVNPGPEVAIDDDGEGAELLPTPQWMTIIEQQVRIAPDGKAVVDVIIELEDISGATEYDVRMTKS
jgi:hypothetical protein